MLSLGFNTAGRAWLKGNANNSSTLPPPTAADCRCRQPPFPLQSLLNTLNVLKRRLNQLQREGLYTKEDLEHHKVTLSLKQQTAAHVASRLNRRTAAPSLSKARAASACIASPLHHHAYACSMCWTT